jgi:spermidine synthase
MIAHPNPQSVLVIGAGEGAAAREILKHPSVQHLVLVDIDGDVNREVKTYLQDWHQGSFDNPKTTLLIQDGKDFVETTQEKFDVIYIDLCDKLDRESPVTALYTSDFYRSVQNILSENGILVVQSMELPQTQDSEDDFIVFKNLQPVFPFVNMYGMFIPSFDGTWGFTVASSSPAVAQLTPDAIDAIIQQRSLTEQLRHYDGITHLHMFSLPKTVRNSLQSLTSTQQTEE